MFDENHLGFVKEGKMFKAFDFKEVTQKLDAEFICASLMRPNIDVRHVPTRHLCPAMIGI